MDNYRYGRDISLVHALAHYIAGGHPYTWEERSHLAIQELQPGQERHLIQIDDVSELHRIRARLERDSEPDERPAEA